MQFCASCGATTVMEESGYKRACTNSSCVSRRSIRNTSYPRTDSSIIAAVESPDRTQTLLIRMRGMMPSMVSCVSGYIEPGRYPVDMVLCARTGPVLGRCCQHRPSIGPVLTHNGMFTGGAFHNSMYRGSLNYIADHALFHFQKYRGSV